MKRFLHSFFSAAGALFFLSGIFFSACKSAPVPPPPGEVSLSLSFRGIEADNPDHLTLLFDMEIKNPLPSAGRGKIASWRAEIDGKAAESGFGLESPGGEVFPFGAAAVLPGEKNVPASAVFPLALNLDMAALTAAGFTPAENCEVTLGAALDLVFDSGENAAVQGQGAAVFPYVSAPEFGITAIAILKAELINTRFRVSVTIRNPNPYPVELSAFGYELFGNGRLWADGTERNIIRIPAKSSAAGNLYLLMNFINMKRDLLDQIIRLEDVNYRFSGEARVSTGVDYLPEFLTRFNLSGYSKVLEN